MRRALHAATELAELRQLEAFPVRATELLRELIPCQHCGYNAIELESGRAVVVANPQEAVFEGGPEALAHLGHQNPLIVRALAGDHSVGRLSDHLSRTQLHRTQQIADTLIVSRRTVEKHFEAIYTHLGVNTRAQAIAAAMPSPVPPGGWEAALAPA